MLPTIASLFGTSVDALLGCSADEKKKFCSDLSNRVIEAIREGDVSKTVDLLREIRINLKDYQDYWFFGIFNEIWDTRLFSNESVLEEMRILTEEIFAVCPREMHYDVIWHMADMEDDEHALAFLDANACREDMIKSKLLLKRYRRREELDKIEDVRKFVLWQTIGDCISVANDWQEYLTRDAAHWKWYCETQLGYLDDICCTHADSSHPVSGGDGVDLWCTERLFLGMRYSVALTMLGDLDRALTAFSDTVSLLERVMAIRDDEFELGCTSPALNGFALKAKFWWMKESDGMRHRQLNLQNNGWNNWIIPIHYLEATDDVLFDSMKKDVRFTDIFKRLERCVVRKAEE